MVEKASGVQASIIQVIVSGRLALCHCTAWGGEREGGRERDRCPGCKLRSQLSGFQQTCVLPVPSKLQCSFHGSTMEMSIGVLQEQSLAQSVRVHTHTRVRVYVESVRSPAKRTSFKSWAVKYIPPSSEGLPSHPLGWMDSFPFSFGHISETFTILHHHAPSQ